MTVLDGKLGSSLGVEIYAGPGICACSVCVPEELTREQIEAEVNAIAPTGISSRWAIAEAETFRGGQPNPCPCEATTGRLHYLLEC